MAVRLYFPRAELTRLGYSRVLIDYLAQADQLLQMLSDISAAQTDISALQTNLTADEARIATLESDFAGVELLERPGIGLAFALATSGGTGPTAVTFIATASENVAAGDFCNFYSNAGSNAIRRADASDPTKYANCFVLAAIASGVAGEVQFAGLNAAVTVSTPASQLYLSDVTPGEAVTGIPTTSGHIVQGLGPAIKGQGVYFMPTSPIEL